MKRILTGLAALASTWSAIVSGAWSHVTHKNHQVGKIQVLTRSFGDLPCFQGSTHTDVEPKKLLAVATDVVGTINWSSAGVTEAKVLKRSSGSLDYYQYLDLPGWTFASDRFWFLRSTHGTEGDSHYFRWQRLEDGGDYGEQYASVKAAHPSGIEPPINVGGWLFTPEDGLTKVQYFICTDVGGTLPTAVQSMATKGTLPDTLGDLITEARRRDASQ